MDKGSAGLSQSGDDPPSKIGEQPTYIVDTVSVLTWMCHYTRVREPIPTYYFHHLSPNVVQFIQSASLKPAWDVEGLFVPTFLTPFATFLMVVWSPTKSPSYSAPSVMRMSMELL